MAKITVTEHNKIAKDARGHVFAALGRPLVTQSGLSAPSAASAQTAVVGNDTRVLRICSDVALHVGFGATATVVDDYYPAGAEIVYEVGKGDQLSYLAG